MDTIVAAVSSSFSSSLWNRVRTHQTSLLGEAERFLHGESLSEAIRDAFYATPRHQFAPRYPDGRPGLWSDVNESLLGEHLETLYADQPFCIYRDELDNVVSTISQPSLVLYMLHLLELESGMTVFELGGGSGWNAALMGRIVGSEGRVFSVEVESALIENANRALADCDLQNVSLTSGDAALGIPNQGPFDRGVFTACAWDLPPFFFQQIKEDGLLLFVLKFSDNNDLLAVLRKTPECFVSELLFPCRFVPIAGEHRVDPSAPTSDSESAFHQWLAAEQLEPDDLDLRIYPIGALESPPPKAHCYDRKDCAFVWSLPE